MKKVWKSPSAGQLKIGRPRCAIRAYPYKRWRGNAACSLARQAEQTRCHDLEQQTDYSARSLAVTFYLLRAPRKERGKFKYLHIKFILCWLCFYLNEIKGFLFLRLSLCRYLAWMKQGKIWNMCRRKCVFKRERWMGDCQFCYPYQRINREFIQFWVNVINV